MQKKNELVEKVNLKKQEEHSYALPGWKVVYGATLYLYQFSYRLVKSCFFSC